MTTLLIWLAIAYLTYGLISSGVMAYVDQFDDGVARLVEVLLVVLFWPMFFPVQMMRAVEGYQESSDNWRRKTAQLNTDYKEAFTRQKQALAAERVVVTQYEDTLAAIEPYINWREITEELDGKFCELWADALDNSHSRADRRDQVAEGEGYSPTDRWWREGLMDRREEK